MLMKGICKLMGIQKTNTTVFHPQMDGLVERFNRTLIDMLASGKGRKRLGFQVAICALCILC